VAGGRGLSPELLSPSEALRLLADPQALEAYSPFGSPLFAVDVREAAPAEPLLDERLAGVSAVTVAVVAAGEEPPAAAAAFDCVVAGAAGLDGLAPRVVARPFASLALVQLLRGSAVRSVEDALVLESFVYSMLQAGSEFATWRATRRAREREADARSPLRVERAGDTLALVFDRPEKRNAFSAALRDALHEALSLAALDDGVRTIEISGAGPDFCSGGDLDEFGSFPDVVTAHAARTTRSAARLLAQLASRVTFRVHGSCIGAGIELPAFAGRVIAADDATFRLPEVSMGLVPGAGGTASLPRRIGRQRTAWLALTGEALDARTALAWGLIDALA
jgi:hypothetical protein